MFGKSSTSKKSGRPQVRASRFSSRVSIEVASMVTSIFDSLGALGVELHGAGERAEAAA